MVPGKSSGELSQTFPTPRRLIVRHGLLRLLDFLLASFDQRGEPGGYGNEFEFGFCGQFGYFEAWHALL